MAKNTEKQVSEEFNSVLAIFTQQGNEAVKAAELVTSAATVVEQLEVWKNSSKIVVADVSQVEEMKQAGKARLVIKRDRVDALKFIATKRAEVKARMDADLKEDKGWLKLSQYIESEAKTIEATLEVAEKFKETFEKQQQEELAARRLEEMSKVCDNAENFPLGTMTEESYQSLLEDLTIAKKAKDKKEADEAAAEQKRVAKIAKLQNERSLQIEKYKNFGDYTDITKLGELSTEDWEKVFDNKKAGFEANEKRIKDGIEAGVRGVVAPEAKPVSAPAVSVGSSFSFSSSAPKPISDKQKLTDYISGLKLPVPPVLKDPKLIAVQEEIISKFDGYLKWAIKEINKCNGK